MAFCVISYHFGLSFIMSSCNKLLYFLVPDGYVTYKRVYRKPESWMTLESKLTKLHVSTEGTIEDERGFLQVA